MDDAIDQMNKTAKTITLFEVRSFEPQMQQMGDIILQASKLILEAMPLLARSARMPDGSTRSPKRSFASRSGRTSYTTRAARRCSSPIGKHAGNVMDFTIGTEIYDHLE